MYIYTHTHTHTHIYINIYIYIYIFRVCLKCTMLVDSINTIWIIDRRESTFVHFLKHFFFSGQNPEDSVTGS